MCMNCGCASYNERHKAADNIQLGARLVLRPERKAS